MTLRESITSAAGTVREILGNNRYLALAGVLVLIVLWWAGVLPDVEIPGWWPIAMIVIGATSVAGWIAAGKISALLPDREGILLISFRADQPGGEIWEVSEDVFADLEVVGGDLYAWEESPKRVYEVRDYRPDENVAVANWRESAPASQLAEPPTVEDAMAAIRGLREDLEPDVAKAREMQRRVRGIVRRLDRERAEAQRSILDETVAPDLGDSTTISEVIDDTLPDDLHPERVDAKDATDDDLDLDGERDLEANVEAIVDEFRGETGGAAADD